MIEYESSSINPYQYDSSLPGLIFPKTVAWRPLQSQPQKQTSWCCDWRPISFAPPRMKQRKGKMERWWSARVVIYQRANIISIPKKSFCLYHSYAGPPGTTTRAGVVTCPDWKMCGFFLEKARQMVSAGCLHNLFYMFLRWFFRVFVELCGGWDSFFLKNTMVFKNARWKQK